MLLFTCWVMLLFMIVVDSYLYSLWPSLTEVEKVLLRRVVVLFDLNLVLGHLFLLCVIQLPFPYMILLVQSQSLSFHSYLQERK